MTQTSTSQLAEVARRHMRWGIALVVACVLVSLGIVQWQISLVQQRINTRHTLSRDSIVAVTALLRDARKTKVAILERWLLPRERWSTQDHVVLGMLTDAVPSADTFAANPVLASRLSTVDGPTGLYNRRMFDDTLQNEWRRNQRLKSWFAAIIVDVDHFKVYNDGYGHQKGDLCLSAVAHAIATAARRSGDFVARYGGEEFAVLLPNTDLVGAGLVADRILGWRARTQARA